MIFCSWGSYVISSDTIRDSIAVDALHNFVQRALESLGVCSSDARTTADVLVTTDTWGVNTHGTKLLLGYSRRLRAGGLRTDAEPFVASEGPAWAIVDGQTTLGQVASVFAMRQAIKKARQVGVAYVGLRNSCHFGGAGYYAWMAAREGLIGLAMANDIPSVAAPGSRGAVIGSNPIAYAVPAGDRDPIMLDVSIATVAGGKVYACQKRGEPIPDGWLIGPDGRPTRDASLFPKQATLAPMSAHKGFGIGLLIESLAAAMTGAAMTTQVGNWMFGDLSRKTNHGAAFLALDAAAMSSKSEFERRISGLIDEVQAAAPADDCERVMVPGQREWENRRRALADGLRLPADVLATLEELAAELAIDFID